jgi:hypothetical protein
MNKHARRAGYVADAAHVGANATKGARASLER